MTRLPTLIAAALLFAGAAEAKTPLFAAECPNGVLPSSEADGDIIVAGDVRKVKHVSDTYWEVAHDHVTYGIMFDPSGVTVSYTGKHGANGMCPVQKLD